MIQFSPPKIGPLVPNAVSKNSKGEWVQNTTDGYQPAGNPSVPEGYNGLDSSIAFEEAKQNGWLVVVPEGDELQIDIDSPEQYKKHTDRLEDFLRFFEVRKTDMHPSKSGAPGKMHITLTLAQDITPIERIALQAILGSDSRRELLSYVRLTQGDKVPTLFLEKKQI